MWGFKSSLFNYRILIQMKRRSINHLLTNASMENIDQMTIALTNHINDDQSMVISHFKKTVAKRQKRWQVEWYEMTCSRQSWVNDKQVLTKWASFISSLVFKKLTHYIISPRICILSIFFFLIWTEEFVLKVLGPKGSEIPSAGIYNLNYGTLAL